MSRQTVFPQGMFYASWEHQHRLTTAAAVPTPQHSFSNLTQSTTGLNSHIFLLIVDGWLSQLVENSFGTGWLLLISLSVIFVSGNTAMLRIKVFGVEKVFNLW